MFDFRVTHINTCYSDRTIAEMDGIRVCFKRDDNLSIRVCDTASKGQHVTSWSGATAVTQEVTGYVA